MEEPPEEKVSPSNIHGCEGEGPDLTAGEAQGKGYQPGNDGVVLGADDSGRMADGGQVLKWGDQWEAMGVPGGTGWAGDGGGRWTTEEGVSSTAVGWIGPSGCDLGGGMVMVVGEGGKLSPPRPSRTSVISGFGIKLAPTLMRAAEPWPGMWLEKW